MEKLLLIIRREFLTKIRNKSFVVMTFLSPILISILAMVVFYITKEDTPAQKQIVVVDASSEVVAKIVEGSETIQFIDYSTLGVEVAKALVQSEGYDGLLYIPPFHSEKEKWANAITLYTEESPGILFVETLEKLIETTMMSANLRKQGVSLESLKNSQVDIALRQSSFSGAIASKLGNGLKMGLGMGVGYLIMMFIVIYGTSVMRSVIEEKTNRVIEIVIASVKPFQLLLGKIIGNTLAGLLQFFCWGLLLLVFTAAAKFAFGVHFDEMSPQLSQVSEMNGVGQIQDVALEIGKLPLLRMFVFFIIYFVGGFLLYSAIYAAIGAAVDTETDTQQFVLPVIIPLIMAVYVGFAAVLTDPHGILSVVFSLVPLTAPIVMPMRIPFGVSTLEIVISIGLLLVSFLGIVRMAAKIYRTGILMYGKKISYRELYKWLRQ